MAPLQTREDQEHTAPGDLTGDEPLPQAWAVQASGCALAAIARGQRQILTANLPHGSECQRTVSGERARLPSGWPRPSGETCEAVGALLRQPQRADQTRRS